MISASDIVYEEGGRTILNKVSFSIADCDKVAIVGPNGAGKSTLLKIMIGELTPDSGKILGIKNSQSFSYMPQHVSTLDLNLDTSVYNFLLSSRGLDKINASLERLLKSMQNPNNSENKIMELSTKYINLLDNFSKAGGDSIDGEIETLMNGLGLGDVDLDRQLSTLSGGQKTKLAFGRVLLSNKDIMILDEPTNHLDESAFEWVISYLKRFRGTLVVVSHDRNFLDTVTDRTFDLSYDGRLTVYRGSLSVSEAKKADLQKHRLKLSAKQEREEKVLKEFIERWRGKKVTQVHDREKKLKRLQNEKAKVVDTSKRKDIVVSFPIKRQPHKNVLSIKGLSKSFGDTTLFENLSFDVYRGEKMAIVGANGIGKSTLLKIITGNLSDYEGTVTLGDGVDIGYYAQEHETLQQTSSVLDEMRRVNSVSIKMARSILAHFLFTDALLNTYVRVLSFGEKSRLRLATLVAGGHNFLVLDEPTNHLDIQSKTQVIKALKMYEGTILLVSHDQELISEIGIDKILVLSEQKIINS